MLFYQTCMRISHLILYHIPQLASLVVFLLFCQFWIFWPIWPLCCVLGHFSLRRVSIASTKSSTLTIMEFPELLHVLQTDPQVLWPSPQRVHFDPPGRLQRLQGGRLLPLPYLHSARRRHQLFRDAAARGRQRVWHDVPKVVCCGRGVGKGVPVGCWRRFWGDGRGLVLPGVVCVVLGVLQGGRGFGVEVGGVVQTVVLLETLLWGKRNAFSGVGQ